MSHCPVCNRRMPDTASGQAQSCKVCGWTTRETPKKARHKRNRFKAESAEEIARRETAKSPFSTTSLLIIGLGILIILMLTFQTFQTNNEQVSDDYIPVYHSAKPSALTATPTPVYTFMAVPSSPPEASPEISPTPTEIAPQSSALSPPELTSAPLAEASHSP